MGKTFLFAFFYEINGSETLRHKCVVKLFRLLSGPLSFDLKLNITRLKNILKLNLIDFVG